MTDNPNRSNQELVYLRASVGITTLEALRSLAASDSRSVSYVVRELLTEALEAREAESKAPQAVEERLRQAYEQGLFTLKPYMPPKGLDGPDPVVRTRPK